MRRPATLAFVVCLSLSTITVAQEVPTGTLAPRSPEIIFHSSSNLVLVDVIALNNGLPDKTLKREDFQVFDNARSVSIETFDSGAQLTTRPLALWFVVQCSMQGYEAKGSGLFTGQISRFVPALKYIERQDTVAVAHWCDDGRSRTLICCRPGALRVCQRCWSKRSRLDLTAKLTIEQVS